MEKGKPGRKRKLSNLSEEEYKQISLWSGDGLNESQIATLLNVNISTITRGLGSRIESNFIGLCLAIRMTFLLKKQEF